MKFKKGKLINLTISLVLTSICFLGLIILQNKITNPNGVTNVIVAKETIDKGTLITDKNVSTLFKSKDKVDKGVVSDVAIKNTKSLVGTVAVSTIYQNEIVNETDVKSKDHILNKINNPREFTIDLKKIGSSVGGTLREGDLIDIVVCNKDLKESSEVLKNVYVDSALTSDGTKINRGQNNPTTIINVIVDKNDVNTLSTAMELGEIKISKVK